MRPTLLNSWLARARNLYQSDFGNKAIWFILLSGFDRLVAVVQTILISRALGTIGFIASIVGLQMGLTATVYVSRYRASEKERAAAVISIVGGFGWAVAATFVVALAPFSQELSMWLLKSPNYAVATLLGIVFVGATVVSGVQDGIAQGFEIFGFLAKLKIIVSTIVVASIYPVAYHFGLTGVVCAVISGLAVKFVVLHMAIGKCRSAADLPAVGSGVSFRSLVGNFALPSMAVSLLVGLVTWAGMLLLSRQEAGFDGVAIANTGLQWRGPVLLLAASLGGVAIPTFSRLFAQGDVHNSRKLRRRLSILNMGAASLVALTLISASALIMSMYGPGFVSGRIAFSMIVLSAVPMVVANVYMQELVGAGRMWRQFWVHLPYALATASAFYLLVPPQGVNGYAASLLLGGAIFLGTVLIVDHVSNKKAVTS